MTKELLEQRYRELQAQAENIRASLYQVVGAIADVEWWMEKLKESDHASEAQQDGQGVQREHQG
jgi:prefoldin subunit 5